MAEEYEIMPHKRLHTVETEIERLKHKKLSPDEKARYEDLKGSMNKLSGSLNNMIDMFSTAATAMHVEEKEEKALDPVMKKLNTLIDQNQKIASGILAVADMFREEIPKMQEALHRLEFMAPRPSASMMPKSGMHPMSRQPSRPVAPNPMHVPGPRPAPGPRPVMPQLEKPPVPPGLGAFEKTPSSRDKRKGMLGGLFSK